MLRRVERYFEFAQLDARWRTEILAGVTTFVTMAYIIFVNPAILGETGMPKAAVMAATCFTAGIASIGMGLFARYPIALAPGMGLNAYFAYTVVKGMGVPWQTALGAVFVSGVAFVILTLAGVREKLFQSLPRDLYAAVAGGIGLFIALLGFRSAGLVIPHPATQVTLGDLRSGPALVSLLGLAIMAALLARGVAGAFLIGILAATTASVLAGLTVWKPVDRPFDEVTATLFQLDIPGALSFGLIEIVFVFLFVDLFDNLGTLVAVSTKARMVRPDGTIPRASRILLTDATATIAGSLAGTSTVVSYIESTAGLVAGGRTGVTAVVTGLLFLLALPLAPLAGAIPTAATAPALILVGAAMMTHLADIPWSDPKIAVPAFLTLTTIPLTFSIANGLALGLTSYTFLQTALGRWREVSWVVWLLTALFVVRFAYLGQG